MTGLTVVSLVILALFAGVLLYLVTRRPSLERRWSPDQAVMPKVEFLDNNRLLIKDIRNINYRTTRDYDLNYYDRNIALDDVQTAWLVISPFGAPGIAHAFLSFGLSDGSFIAVSIEVRRQKKQKFSPFKAFIRQFEMMYVIADEKDVIKVRTNCVKDKVRLFPVQAEKKVIRAVFLDVMKRADQLGRKPEFYNTLWNNCTTNIIVHTRRFSQKPIPFWNIHYLFAESLDKIAYELNIIDTHLPYSAAREHFDITTLAQACDNGEDFSKAIRKHLVIRPVD